MTIAIHEARFSIARSPAEGVELLAIGDIHGEIDLLDALLDRAAALPRAGRRVLVFTGDLIDRGPASLAALDATRAAAARVGAQDSVLLMGNHEQVLRCAIEGEPARREAAFALWLHNGGDAMMREAFGRDWQRVHGLADLRAAMAPRLDILRAMRSHWASGDVLCVHAGLSPDMPPDLFLAAPWDVDFETLDEAGHWAWIREPFLDAPSHGGRFVVHGHTPDDGTGRRGADIVAGERINLDLGSGRTGRARLARIRAGSVETFDAVR